MSPVKFFRKVYTLEENWQKLKHRKKWGLVTFDRIARIQFNAYHCNLPENLRYFHLQRYFAKATSFQENQV